MLVIHPITVCSPCQPASELIYNKMCRAVFKYNLLECAATEALKGCVLLYPSAGLIISSRYGYLDDHEMRDHKCHQSPSHVAQLEVRVQAILLHAAPKARAWCSAQLIWGIIHAEYAGVGWDTSPM